MLVWLEMSIGGFKPATSPPCLLPSPITGPTLYLLPKVLMTEGRREDIPSSGPFVHVL